MGLLSHKSNDHKIDENELYKKALSELMESMEHDSSDYATPGAILLHHDLQEQNKKLDKIIELLQSK